MMICEPYSIVAVPFPFTDSATSKKRPALVMSSRKFQKENKHVTLMMITTAKNSSWYGDHEIQNLSSTGLTTPSVIRQKIFTLDSRLILKVIGKLSTEDCFVVSNNFDTLTISNIPATV